MRVRVKVALIEVNVGMAEGRKGDTGSSRESGWSIRRTGAMGDDLAYAVGGR